jgi:hypothetical protein
VVQQADWQLPAKAVSHCSVGLVVSVVPAEQKPPKATQSTHVMIGLVAADVGEEVDVELGVEEGG